LGFAVNIALTRKSAIAQTGVVRCDTRRPAKRRWKREIVRLPTLRKRIGTAFGTARLVEFALSADDALLFRSVGQIRDWVMYARRRDWLVQVFRDHQFGIEN
jgi:hypothetical protein